jgi:hypothetical protein
MDNDDQAIARRRWRDSIDLVNRLFSDRFSGSGDDGDADQRLRPRPIDDEDDNSIRM